MIHIEDYEHEAQKDLVYLQEEMHEFYSSLNDPNTAQIEVVLSQKQDGIELQKIESLQKNAKLNESIPASIIVKGDKRLLKYNERKIDTLPF